MLQIVENLAVTDKTTLLATACAYIDTIEVFYRKRFPVELLRALRLAIRRRVWTEPVKTREGVLVGWVLIINQPTRDAIEALERHFTDKMSICKLHVAYDLTPCPGVSRDRMIDVVSHHMHLKRQNRRDLRRDHLGTLYAIDTANRKTPISKNLVAYFDRPSKVTGELDQIHVELRLLKSRIIKAAGIHRPIDLLNIKPHKLFAKHVTIKDHAERLINETIRTTKPTPYIDVPSRVRGWLKRSDMGTSTDFKRHNQKQYERISHWDCIDIAEKLDWVPAKVV